VDAGFWLVGAFGSIRSPLAALFVRSGALPGDLAKAFMQHTLHLSAYVSIRQHTSAYVSIRLGQSIDAADVAPWQAANIEGLSRQMLKLL
jgi:hypothetical protein